MDKAVQSLLADPNFPLRKHKGRVAFYLDIIKCKYHIARV